MKEGNSKQDGQTVISRKVVKIQVEGTIEDPGRSGINQKKSRKSIHWCKENVVEMTPNPRKKLNSGTPAHMHKSMRTHGGDQRSRAVKQSMGFQSPERGQMVGQSFTDAMSGGVCQTRACRIPVHEGEYLNHWKLSEYSKWRQNRENGGLYHTVGRFVVPGSHNPVVPGKLGLLGKLGHRKGRGAEHRQRSCPAEEPDHRKIQHKQKQDIQAV